MDRRLIAYDVPDDRRRTKLAHLLDDFGDRVQYSVFEIETDEQGLRILRERIMGVIKPEEDKVRLYPLCASCLAKIEDLGKVERKAFDRPELIIV